MYFSYFRAADITLIKKKEKKTKFDEHALYV